MTNYHYNTDHHVTSVKPSAMAPSPEAIKEKLFWAGSLVLSLKDVAPKPSIRLSFNPHTNHSQKLSLAEGHDGDKLDRTLALVTLVKDPLTRKIINSRLIINPLTGRHIYSWQRISTFTGLSVSSIKSRFLKGLVEITRSINPQEWEKL